MSIPVELSGSIPRLNGALDEAMWLAEAIEQIAEGVAILDTEGRILFTNRAFRAHHGIARDEALGRPIVDILRIEEDGQRARLIEALASARSWGWNMTLGGESDAVRELALTVYPILDASDRLLEGVVIERDVTREGVIEGRLRQWQKMEALGTLAGGIAHDFNSILLPIQINAELMLASAKEDSPEAKRLSQILDASRRGRDMVGQILAFARQKDQDRRPVDVAAVVRESVKLLRISMPKTITIAEKIEVPSAFALADPTQIGQILMNLGSNAAHAMRESCGTFEVGLAGVALDAEDVLHFIGMKPGAYLRLTAADTGPGIPRAVLDRIFEPFFTTKKSGEGSGLGLSVVHGIVKAHGGAITVSSEPGRGTKFTILLPRITPPPGTKKGLEVDVPRGTERVLFVDDEILQAKAMSRLLGHLGYRVTALNDPVETLETFRKDPASFDLVILDQTMPRMTGGQLATEILRLRPAMPIILCTGFSEGLNEEQAAALGIRAFLWKPFSLREIALLIRQVLQPGP
jgi:PAS domain S-box-containing protein